jgi:hypothetical protein
MKRFVSLYFFLAAAIFSLHTADIANAWNDETHISVAKAAGYRKWFNATGADMSKLKTNIENGNHYVNNPLDTVVTPEMVMQQVERYNQVEETGHLYGAIIGAFRDYIKDKALGKYGEYHMGFCAHYVGDLSQPLHNISYDEFNMEYHRPIDGVINDEVLDNLSKITLYPITVKSEADLAREIARIANLAIALATRLEAENRMITKQEAYRQISHSASLLRAGLTYAETLH